jgi:hypothetical protein
MRAAGRLTRTCITLGVAVWFAACGPATEPLDEPSRITLQLFELGRDGEPDDGQVALLFDDGADAGGGGLWRARLYDALGELARAPEPRVTSVERLDGLERIVVDVECDLPFEGRAAYSVQLSARPDGRLTVVAFDGPGVSWPPRQRGRSSGLSTWPDR